MFDETLFKNSFCVLQNKVALSKHCLQLVCNKLNWFINFAIKCADLSQNFGVYNDRYKQVTTLAKSGAIKICGATLLWILGYFNFSWLWIAICKYVFACDSVKCLSVGKNSMFIFDW